MGGPAVILRLPRPGWPEDFGGCHACPETDLGKRFRAELDRLDRHPVRQHRLVLPNLADHRLDCLALEEEHGISLRG